MLIFLIIMCLKKKTQNFWKSPLFGKPLFRKQTVIKFMSIKLGRCYRKPAEEGENTLNRFFFFFWVKRKWKTPNLVYLKLPVPKKEIKCEILLIKFCCMKSFSNAKFCIMLVYKRCFLLCFLALLICSLKLWNSC